MGCMSVHIKYITKNVYMCMYGHYRGGGILEDAQSYSYNKFTYPHTGELRYLELVYVEFM